MKITQIVKGDPDFSVDVVNTVVKGVSDNFQRLAYSEEDLMITLSNRIKAHENEVRESKTMLGRFMGLFTNPINPDRMEIDGMRLHQIFELAGQSPSTKIILGASYIVDPYELQQLMIRAEHKIKKRPQSQR
ncbi:hypothetical protein [Pelagibius sp. Alg239-R121]|uniref:hypothetical protein n=1 Tax=Pelagibius sp. Alg239-R121 TaxID=2993448 RepID=UPI0024A7924F|nr:hypothetical protein [Pelagibius sp. Alg239-R121]